ncbi:CPBP family intramembrane metalloprotease [Sulfurimonas sp. MAG313]|nr:CPBP family intramembrane glutamic endopeptidase [Sulfurimonas sp. MAG313]MDF1880173.1 CPBP family intramembrane metalloprotease [Sulfurimonas sp. MAG313]
MKNFWLRVEFLFIFIALPLLGYLNPKYISPIPVLIFILSYVFYLSLRHKKIRKRNIFTFHHHHHKLLKGIYNRILVSLIVLMVAIIFYDHHLIFKMILQDPLLWIILLFIYPLFSVIPQEIIFRSFFFARYKKIFKRYPLVFMSAASFSFSHIIFNNWIAIIFTFIGGLYFAISYHQTKSLLVVVIEHSIYGLFLYTIGFGEFFDFNAMQD